LQDPGGQGIYGNSNSHPKSKFFMWLLLNKESLTWDIPQKIIYEGPNQCYLCKANLETKSHLIMTYAYILEVKKETYHLSG